MKYSNALICFWTLKHEKGERERDGGSILCMNLSRGLPRRLSYEAQWAELKWTLEPFSFSLAHPLSLTHEKSLNFPLDLNEHSSSVSLLECSKLTTSPELTLTHFSQRFRVFVGNESRWRVSNRERERVEIEKLKLKPSSLRDWWQTWALSPFHFQLIQLWGMSRFFS